MKGLYIRTPPNYFCWQFFLGVPTWRDTAREIDRERMAKKSRTYIYNVHMLLSSYCPLNLYHVFGALIKFD